MPGGNQQRCFITITTMCKWVSEWVESSPGRVLLYSAQAQNNSVDFTHASPSAAAVLGLWKGLVPTEGFGKTSFLIKQKREEGFCLQPLQLETLKCTVIRGVGWALVSPSWKRGDELLTSIMPGIQKQSRIGLSDLRYTKNVFFWLNLCLSDSSTPSNCTSCNTNTDCGTNPYLYYPAMLCHVMLKAT